VLEKDGKQHTLHMGGSELADDSAGDVVAAAPKPSSSERRPSAPSGPVGGDMPVPEEFGEDMLSWAESMSLGELERLYVQYGDYLSPEQRAQADAYLEQRRARGN
jgi:hypothetical protein